MKRLAIFASGSGSNAEAIAHHLADSRHEVGILVTNNPEAGVLDRLKRFEIRSLLTSDLQGPLEAELRDEGIDAIALAGYLKLIPKALIQAYPNRIWNIHPALLPAYGGKGMYGDRIHRRVLKDRASFTGVTIHAVNEKYDEGKILFQAAMQVEKEWHLEELTRHIHRLEHRYYPKVLHLLLDELESSEK